MRILAVIDSLRLGGAETQLAEVLTLFTEHRGHDCLVCSLLPSQTAEARFGPKVDRVYLNKKSRFSLPRLCVDVAQLVRRYAPDVTYSRLTYANAVTRVATWFPRSGVTHVAGIDTVPYDFATPHRPRRTSTTFYQALERRADRIVCNSEGTAQAVIAEGYSVHRVRVVPNGIDVDRFRPPLQRALRTPTRLVCITALRPEKGVGRLLRIIAPLLQSRRAVLTVVGDGPERSTVQQVISELGLAEGVRLVGATLDILPILHESELYVSASFVEGFGIAIAEAAATGIPAVCIDAPGGLREVVIDGVTGYLVPIQREDLFEKKVRQLSEEAELRQRMGTAARNHVVRRFNLQDIGRQLESILEPE